MKNNRISMMFVWVVSLILLLPFAVCAESYSYDAAGRLTGVVYDDSSTISYSYDNNGNMLSRNVGAAATVSVSLNATAFNTSAVLNLSAITVASTPATMADVYVALQMPDGSILAMQPNLTSFSATLSPVLSNAAVPNFSGQIFSYTFSGAEPVGNYKWLAALMQPGTLTPIGSIKQVTFTFAP